MSDLITDLDGWRKAHSNIQRKLNIAGIDYDRSVMYMVEEAKKELIRLRDRKAIVWDWFKSYVSDRLSEEKIIQEYLAKVLTDDQLAELANLLNPEGNGETVWEEDPRA